MWIDSLVLIVCVLVFFGVGFSFYARFRLVRMLKEFEPNTYSRLGYPGAIGIVPSIELQQYITKRLYRLSPHEGVRAAAHALWAAIVVIATCFALGAAALVGKEIWLV